MKYKPQILLYMKEGAEKRWSTASEKMESIFKNEMMEENRWPHVKDNRGNIKWENIFQWQLQNLCL